MQLKVTSVKDLCSGLLFFTIGGIALGMSLRYSIGSLSRMGPGYFPAILSVVMVILSAIFLVRSITIVAAPPRGFRPVALLAILGGAGLFAAFIDQLGIAISAVLLIVVTYLGGWEYRWRELAMLAGILTLLVVILFVLLLRMQFTIGPSAWS